MTRARLARALGAVVGGMAVAWMVGTGGAARMPRAEAGEAPETGNVKFAAKIEPEKVAPGEQGVLVITGTIRKTMHVFADKKFVVTVAPVKGVDYGKIATSKPAQWKDPEFPDDPPSDVWFDLVVVRIPFTVGPEVVPPVRVGAKIKFSGCDHENCFSPEETKEPVGADVVPPAGWAPASAKADPSSAPAAAGGGLTNGTGPTPAPPAMAGGGLTDGTGPTPGAPAPSVLDVKSVWEHADVTVTVRATDKTFVVTFAPTKGMHVYRLGSEEGTAVTAHGIDAAGVEWSRPEAKQDGDEEVREPYDVTIPYADRREGTNPVAVHVAWQACEDAGQRQCHTPPPPHTFTLTRQGTGATLTDVEEPAAKPTVLTSPPGDPSRKVAEHGLLFPDPEAEGSKPPEEESSGPGLVLLLLAFVTGIGMAFTPCVLPIIPITVSVIGGGRTDLAKGRLTFLLLSYVTGLSLAFGTMGLAASAFGASLSAAFERPGAIWGIAALFFVLSLGMFGIYELQPPAWMQKFQGQRKGGSVIGAFLFGAIAAVIASPCTGPVIAGMAVQAAKEGQLFFGFLRFAMVGLGMGAVFFAAGSLNLVMKPGPWMVWIRHGFGIVMTGVALYYLAHSDLLVPPTLFYVGFALAALVGFGVARHRVKREGEEVGKAAKEGTGVAVALVLATAVVAFMNRESEDLGWIQLQSREHLVAEVEKANKDGKAVIVDVWATWCSNCKKWDKRFAEIPSLRRGLSGLHRLRINVTDGPREDLREGLGMSNTQPYLLFIDSHGNIRRKMDIKAAPDDAAEETVVKHLKRLEELK